MFSLLDVSAWRFAICWVMSPIPPVCATFHQFSMNRRLWRPSSLWCQRVQNIISSADIIFVSSRPCDICSWVFMSSTLPLSSTNLVDPLSIYTTRLAGTVSNPPRMDLSIWCTDWYHTKKCSRRANRTRFFWSMLSNISVYRFSRLSVNPYKRC